MLNQSRWTRCEMQHIGMVFQRPNFAKSFIKYHLPTSSASVKKILRIGRNFFETGSFMDHQVKDDLHNQPWHFQVVTSNDFCKRAPFCEARYLTHGWACFSAFWSDCDSAIKKPCLSWRRITRLSFYPQHAKQSKASKWLFCFFYLETSLSTIRLNIFQNAKL